MPPSQPNGGPKRVERRRKQSTSLEQEGELISRILPEGKKKGSAPVLSWDQQVQEAPSPKIAKGGTPSRLRAAADYPRVLDAPVIERKTKAMMVSKSKEPKSAVESPTSVKRRKAQIVSTMRQLAVDVPPPPSASLSWDERMLNCLLKYGGRMAAFLHVHFKQVLSCVLIAFMCVLWACKYFYLLSSDSIKSSIAVHLSLAVQLLIDIKDVSKQCVAKTLQSPKTNVQDKQLPKDKEIVVETWADLWHYLLDCHFRAWAVVSNALDYIAIRSMMAAGGLCMILVLPFALLFAFAALLLWYYRCIMLRIAWTEKKIEAVLFRIRMKWVELEMAVERWMMPFLRAVRFYRRSFVDQLEQRSSVLRELVGPELGFTLALLASMLWTVDAFMADAHLENHQEEDYLEKLFFAEENHNGLQLQLTEDELRLVEAIPDEPRQGFYLGPHSCPPSPRIPRPVHRQKRECLYLRPGQLSKKANLRRKPAVEGSLLVRSTASKSAAEMSKLGGGGNPAELQRSNTVMENVGVTKIPLEGSGACSASDSKESTAAGNLPSLKSQKHVRRVGFADLSSLSFQDPVLSGAARDHHAGNLPCGGILKRKEEMEEETADQQVNRFIISIRGDQSGIHPCESSRMEKGFASTGRVREYGDDCQADPLPTFRCAAPERRRPYGAPALAPAFPKPALLSLRRYNNSRVERDAEVSGIKTSDQSGLARAFSVKGKVKPDGVGRDRKMKRLYTYPNR
ncbi:hypothetical protein CBR_g17644 [Chara braunii]|uniref:Uncharacterized protein n=1 Tax=Chara braunii TaxID=69332 RepID=A0A388KV50_CHABU|nr:hypothetical protein CBR_g17644 [Chara braunii]|eukprot:GBG73929.1 hypothetical protein CBR_g17644 [Chara braunii]